VEWAHFLWISSGILTSYHYLGILLCKPIKKRSYLRINQVFPKCQLNIFKGGQSVNPQNFPETQKPLKPKILSIFHLMWKNKPLSNISKAKIFMIQKSYDISFYWLFFWKSFEQTKCPKKIFQQISNWFINTLLKKCCNFLRTENQEFNINHKFLVCSWIS
jgi:hypothetical protein